MKRYLLLSTFLLVTVFCLGQTDTVRYEPTFRFPMNPVAKTLMLGDLNHFLNAHYSASELQTDLMTMPLTDELVNIQVNPELKSPAFYKPYLNNMVLLDDTSYLLQLSFIGVSDGMPLLRASFELFVRRSIEHFLFSSPLIQNTNNWKKKTLDHMTFIFPDHMDESKALQFAKLDAFYNEKINRPGQQTIFIEAENFPSALRLIGVDFKLDYAGYAYNSLSDYKDNRRVVISGRKGRFPDYDPHDTWHDKLRTVMPDSVINRPVDEGCAYLFGGSWGYSWQQVLDSFHIYVHQHPDANWIELYKSKASFSMGNYPNAICNILNSLLVEKIQKEKGFPAVMPLLSCGRRQNGDANYFAELQKITGITPVTFNAEIKKLL